MNAAHAVRSQRSGSERSCCASRYRRCAPSREVEVPKPQWSSMEWNGIESNRIKWNGMERNGMGHVPPFASSREWSARRIENSHFFTGGNVNIGSTANSNTRRGEARRGALGNERFVRWPRRSVRALHCSYSTAGAHCELRTAHMNAQHLHT